jgi:hypothetical protein
MGKIIPNFEKIKKQKQKLFELLLIFSTGKPERFRYPPFNLIFFTLKVKGG